MLKDTSLTEKAAESTEDGSSASSKATADKDTTRIDQPGVNDVLCGKDKTYGNHPGNQKFRSMIESFVEIYKGNHSKQDKMQITRRIVTAMKQRYNTRFIRRVKSNGCDMWEQISDSIARDKVSHALRFAANMKKARPSILAKKDKHHYHENDYPATLLQSQKRNRGTLVQSCGAQNGGGGSGHHRQLSELAENEITGFPHSLGKDKLLRNSSVSLDFVKQYISQEPILRFQSSISNESRDGYLGEDIEPTPLHGPYRHPYLPQQTSIGTIEPVPLHGQNPEALLNSLRSEDFQILLHGDIEKDWV